MARSANDATRFTASVPHAHSSNAFSQNPNPGATTASQISFGGSAPANETPQQKIARLRAAAAQARGSQDTQFDRVVRVGRIWADRAHRFTALGLIGLTVLSGMVAAAGISDMLLHNRRRRNEWMAEQQAKTAMELVEAKKARSEGRATEDQMLLINRERAAAEAAEAKKNRPGIFKRAGSWLTGGFAAKEEKGGRLGAEAREAAAMRAKSEELLGEKEDRGVLQAVQEKVDANRRTGEMVSEIVRPAGGPLDQRAQLVSDAVVGTGKSWTKWVTGR